MIDTETSQEITKILDKLGSFEHARRTYPGEFPQTSVETDLYAAVLEGWFVVEMLKIESDEVGNAFVVMIAQTEDSIMDIRERFTMKYAPVMWLFSTPAEARTFLETLIGTVIDFDDYFITTHGSAADRP